MPVPDLALSDEALERAFGHETLRRARAYAVDGSVKALRPTEYPDGSFEARAAVKGSRSAAYYTQLNVDAGDDVAVSICTCPVGQQCKHGAALALVTRSRRVPAPPATWQTRLTGVLDELDRLAPPVSGDMPLALEMSYATPRTRYHAVTPVPRLLLRPLRLGAREQWVKTGAQWHELRTARTNGRYDTAHVAALIRLAEARSGARDGLIRDTVAVDEFGPDVWALLDDVRAAGVPILHGAGVRSVALVEGGSLLGADLTVGSGDLVLRAGVLSGDGWHYGSTVTLVGSPAHGAVVVTPARGSVDLLLTALDQPVGSATGRLVVDDEPVRIDQSSFETDFLPRLQRRFQLFSSDDSVTIPEPPTPRLRVVVTWHSSVHADVRWLWVYGEQSCALDAPLTQPVLGLRDHAAERELLARLATETGGMAPPSHSVVRGPEVLDLADVILPLLYSTDLVEVIEEERPDFRAAEGDPELRFDVADTDAEAPAATDWLNLRIAITLDGESIPLVDVITALSTQQSRIILASGLHVATDRPEFEQLRDLLTAAGELREVTGDTVGVGSHDLGLWAQLADLGIVDQQAADWVARARALRDLVELPRPDPVGVVSTLRSYQLDGFRWLAFLWQHGLGGILADDMGLGKTLQVLTLVSHARSAGAAPFLVVAPTSVVGAWHAEAARHTPGLVVRAVTASAARREQSLAELADGADVVVTSYTLLRLEQEQYADLAWGGLVMDEAQQAKNHQGKTYHALRRVEAPMRLAVTGTPFENRLIELWALLSLTVPGLYPWPKAFTDNVAAPVEKAGDAAALHRFRQRIRPFVLRRSKELVADDLPAKQEQVLEVSLSPKHRKVYDTHLQRERQKVLGLVGDFNKNRVAIFSALTRLRQLALSPALVDDDHAGIGSAKLDALVDHVEEIVAEGHRVLVFSQFTRFLQMARDRLTSAGISTAYLDGRTRRRAEVIDGFRHGDAAVFLISLKAGGVGLTLTEADYVFVLDPWWNPASEAQAVDRAHRIGQQRPVMVYRLVARDTIEDKVMELKARKAALFAQVVSGDGALSGALEADDVRALFD